jgi:hypothetical protein
MMHLIEWKHYRRRETQPSPAPHKSNKEAVDCLLCSDPGADADAQDEAHNIMSSTSTAKSTEIVTRMWELERKEAERECVWCVRAVAQGRIWMRAFRSGRKGNAYRTFCRMPAEAAIIVAAIDKSSSSPSYLPPLPHFYQFLATNDSSRQPFPSPPFLPIPGS